VTRACSICAINNLQNSRPSPLTFPTHIMTHTLGEIGN
jgi:hypothetical protein